MITSTKTLAGTASKAAPASIQPKWKRMAHERPTALFEAALKVFAKRGYHAARLEEVAEAAGVSKGTIYHYFRNKEDLLSQTLECKRTVHLARMEDQLKNFEGTASEKLRFLAESGWKTWTGEDWGRYTKLMFGEIANELPDIFLLSIQQSLLRVWKFTEDVIREGQKSGEFRKDANAKAIARFIHSGLSYQALLQVHMGIAKLDRCPLAQIFESSLDLVIRGLKDGTSQGKKK
jgi:AcrR family transcriptional regulator